MSGSSAEPAEALAELREIRRTGFTISRLHRRGAAPFRLLVIGSRSVVGPRRPAEDARWFAEHLADRTWLQLRRGVDLDVLWELRPVLRALRRSVAPWRLWRYDVVVVVLSAAPAGAARLRLLGVRRLVRPVLRRVAALSSVLLVALEPSRAHRSMRLEPLAPPPGAVPDDAAAAVRTIVLPQDPRISADRIAAQLAAVATAPPAHPAAPAAAARHEREEDARVRALEELGLPARRGSRELVRLARAAQSAFDADLCAINIVERERAVTVATSGSTPATELPRRVALCNLAMGARDVTIIEDTWARPELADNPLLRGTPPIRFFAAYPLESVEGHRIGAFCVYDAVPRSPEEVDVELLRELALLTEAELNRQEG